MSSHILTRRHFDSIATGIKNQLGNRDFYLPRRMDKYLQAGRNSPVAMQRVDEMTAMLADIQIVSVCRQYNSESSVQAAIAERRQVMGIQSRKPLTLPPVPLYRAIACALYQIEEWQVEKDHPITTDERECLDFFDEFHSYLARHIVSRLPEYDKAPWGIE